MTIVTLYEYEREPGKITVSPIEPPTYIDILYRLIADEGYELVKEDTKAACIDTQDTAGWNEVIAE